MGLRDFVGSRLTSGWTGLGCALPVLDVTAGADVVASDAPITLHLPASYDTPTFAPPQVPNWERTWLDSPTNFPADSWGEKWLDVSMIYAVGLSILVDDSRLDSDAARSAFFDALEEWVMRFAGWAGIGAWQLFLGRGTTAFYRASLLMACDDGVVSRLDAPQRIEVSMAPRPRHSVASLAAAMDLALTGDPPPEWIMAYRALERHRRGDHRGAIADGCSALEQLLWLLFRRQTEGLPPKVRDHMRKSMERATLGTLLSALRAMFGSPTNTLEDNHLVEARNSVLHKQGVQPPPTISGEMVHTAMALCEELLPLRPDVVATDPRAPG